MSDDAAPDEDADAGTLLSFAERAGRLGASTSSVTTSDVVALRGEVPLDGGAAEKLAARGCGRVFQST